MQTFGLILWIWEHVIVFIDFQHLVWNLQIWCQIKTKFFGYPIRSIFESCLFEMFYPFTHEIPSRREWSSTQKSRHQIWRGKQLENQIEKKGKNQLYIWCGVIRRKKKRKTDKGKRKMHHKYSIYFGSFGNWKSN